MTQFQLRQSTLAIEGTYNASKWLKHQLLVSKELMCSLFDELKGAYIAHASGPVDRRQAFVSFDELLFRYGQYVESIKKGMLVHDKELRRFFCNYLTYDLSCLYAIDAGQERTLIKVARPVVQMQFHHFLASAMDGKFHSMAMSSESIHFGIQFSYPQIFEDPQNHQYFKVVEDPSFPNTLLFKKIILWLRRNTMPAPMVYMGKKTRAPFRIEKESFSWINNHPQLRSKGISIEQ